MGKITATSATPSSSKPDAQTAASSSATGSLPAKESGSSTQPEKVEFRSGELAALSLELGDHMLPLRSYGLNRAVFPRPDTPVPDADAGTFAGVPVTLRGELHPQELQAIASQALSLLNQWEQAIGGLPPHLRHHDDASAPNENVLSQVHAGSVDESRAFEKDIRRKLAEEMVAIHAPDDIQVMRDVIKNASAQDEEMRQKLEAAGHKPEDIERMIKPSNRYGEELKDAGLSDAEHAETVKQLERYRTNLVTAGATLNDLVLRNQQMCRYGAEVAKTASSPAEISLRVEQMCQYEVQLAKAAASPDVDKKIAAMRSYSAAEEKAKAELAEAGHSPQEIVRQLEQMQIQKRGARTDEPAGTSLEWKRMCESLQTGIENCRREVAQTGHLSIEFVKDQHKQLVRARTAYQALLGMETAKAGHLGTAGEASEGPAMHGDTRSDEQRMWRMQAGARADALRNKWTALAKTEADMLKEQQKTGADDETTDQALQELWKGWWQENRPDAKRSDRPIPAILSPKRALSIETGLFSKQRTPAELGIENIVQRFFPETPGTPSVFDLTTLVPKLTDLELRNHADIAQLMSALASSPAPFHVLCIPGTQDGSIERTFVFRNAGTPQDPHWEMLPRIGDPFDQDVVSLGLARNVEAPVQRKADEADPWLGSAFPSAEEKRNAPLPKRFSTDPSKNTGIMRMSSDDGIKTKLPALEMDIMERILSRHMDSVEGAGKGKARITVMSPPTNSWTQQHSLARHLGYDIKFRNTEFVGPLAAFQQAGFLVTAGNLDGQGIDRLRNGAFDQKKIGTIMRLYLEDGTSCMLAWSGKERDQALVASVDNNNPAFRKLGWTNNQVLPMTMSQCLKHCESQFAVARVGMGDIGSSKEGNVVRMLAGGTSESAHTKLMNLAQAKHLPLASVGNFGVLSHLFAKQHPDAVAATYALAANDAAVAALGKAMDEAKGNLMLEFAWKMSSAPQPQRQRQRICFQAPGSQPDKNQIIGRCDAINLPDFKGPPSKLLNAIMRNNGERAEISVLSTGALRGNGLSADAAPSWVQDALAGLMHAGLPLAADDEDNKDEFVDLVQNRHGVFPKELTGKALADVTMALVNRYAPPDEKIDVSHRLSVTPPVLDGGDYLGCLIQVRTKDGIRNITFQKNALGAIEFTDPDGKTHPAAQLNQCAIDQKWHAAGPIDVLQFKGKLVQFYEDEQSDASMHDAPAVSPGNTSSAARKGKEIDLAEDTEWEDDDAPPPAGR